ncbi:class I SAM-dependent methyltransferase [Kineococcus sp. NPDC059986]|uniref:class I SAM-dependent methyltransferase n=1 Tax=Kineococcus sp. NPDC059986 TaxID=3155538 RepID=UPI00344B8860
MNTRVQELERIAAQYHLNDDVVDKFIEDLCQEYCCDWLATLVQPAHDVVELGYGEGVTVSRLGHLARRYTVVEGAPTLAERLRTEHPDLVVAEALFEDWLPPQPCDVLLALHVFEHVDDPVALARHLRSWVAPDGEMVVIVPNRDSLHRRLGVAMGLQPELDTLSPRDLLVGHQRVYDLDGLEADLAAGGFETVERRGFFAKALPNALMLGLGPEHIRGLNVLAEGLPASLCANIAVRVRPIG